MKHWKSGFFLIDRRAITDVMVWRHPNVAINDPRPATGSFNMADVCRLSAHVIKLRDIPEGVLVLSGLSRFWKNRFCDPMLQGADGNAMGIHDFLCIPEWTGVEVLEEPHLDDLAAGTPSSKILAKAEASQKRKVSTSGAASSHVAKRTRSALAQSSGGTTRPSLFAGDDDESNDDDACVEITLDTPLRSAEGKGIMVDDAAAPSGGVSRQRLSSAPAPSFRDVSSDAIHTDFFPFSVGPYYATYPEDGVARNCVFTREEGDAPYRCLLKGYEEKVAGLTGLELQVSTLKKQVSGLNDKLATSDASFSKSKAKGKERKKKIKFLSKSLDNFHSEEARLSATLNQATILEAEKDEEILNRVQCELLSLAASAGFERGLRKACRSFPLVAQSDYAFLNKISMYAAEPLSVILQLEPEKLVCSANVPIPRDTRVSPPIAKESTMKPVSKSLELSANVVSASFAIALEQNEEQASVAGTSHVLDDVVEVTVVGSESVSSGLTDVVVALSVGEKGDGLLLLLPLKRARACGMPENTCCSELGAN
ncbi:hypothetical protein Tco_0744809 [Tanacetum coccineum]